VYVVVRLVIFPVEDLLCYVFCPYPVAGVE
jgi:hypothetical protein